jgi:hypothetical protein
MARRAAVIIKYPDAHFAKLVAGIIAKGGGLSRLTVFERTYGIFPTESWALEAALQEYIGAPNATAHALYLAAERATWRDASGQPWVSEDYLVLLEL